MSFVMVQIVVFRMRGDLVRKGRKNPPQDATYLYLYRIETLDLAIVCNTASGHEAVWNISYSWLSQYYVLTREKLKIASNQYYEASQLAWMLG
jgi:hypothetical protein